MNSSQGRNSVAISLIALASATAMPAWAQEASDQEAQDKDIVVYGLPIAEDTPQSATGLALTLRETPQSITVIDSQRITEFAMNNTAQVLEQVVGLNVDRGESDRTVFNARGFDVTNFQVDGIGIPLLGGIQYGETDSYLYERIEVIRGANGLTTGVGNPSATINYIRKRPTSERRLLLGAYAGSYDSWRVEADANVPLTEDGGIAVRLIGAHEQRDSHLFNYDMKRNLFAATISAELSSELKATAGFTYQQSKSNGSGWGSVTHFYADGGRIDFDRSINFAPDWTNWPVLDEQAYVELAYSPSSKWTIKGVLTYKHFAESPMLLYVYGNPDRVTGLGLGAQASDFASDTKRYLADLYATGRFSLFGREHQLTFGLSWTRSDWLQWQANATDNPQVLPDFRNFDTVHIPQPPFGPTILQLDQRETQKRAYIATQLNFTDWLKAVVGTSYADFQTRGTNYGVSADRGNKEFNPYVGVLVDPLPNVTVYASYTSIFNPQVEVDFDRVRLPAIKGTNLEAGIKSELFGKRLYVAAAIFRTKQANLALFAGTRILPNGDFYNYYDPVDSVAEGFEIELAGKITDQWQVSGGYTGLRIEDDQGNPIRNYQPRKTLKLSTTYRIPEISNLAIGAQARWQSDTYETLLYLTTPSGAPIDFRQKAYAVFDMMAGIDINEQLRLTANIRNLTNKKYMQSMVYAAYGQGLYAPGRNFTISLNAKF